MYETEEEYQSFFLDVFQLKEYDEKKIEMEVDRIFNSLSCYKPFLDMLNKMGQLYFHYSEEEYREEYLKDIFIYLFSYTHLFNLTLCIQEYNERKEIKEELLQSFFQGGEEE
jgi:hypothetical protein